MSHAVTYRHLNLERSWPSFVRHGLEITADGAMRLAALPSLEPVSDPLPPLPGLEGPAGIGADDCGNVYITDPAEHRVLRIPDCGEPEPLACLRGPGTGPGELHTPRGITVGPRKALYVADSRNARIVVVDLDTEQIRGYWDGRSSDAAGRPFLRPWDVAAHCEWVYVADPGISIGTATKKGGSLRRFHADGSPDAAFGGTLAMQDVRPLAPIGVAVGVLAQDPDPRVLVLDSRPRRLLVYTLDGTYDAHASHRWGAAVGGIQGASSVAVSEGNLYVTDPTRGRVLVFDGHGAFLGVAANVDVNVAGLGVDCHGRLLLHPGGGGAIRRALGQPVFASCGTFLAGPFRAPSDPTSWQRIRLRTGALPRGAHFTVYTLTSDTLDGSPGNRPAAPVTCLGSSGAVVPSDAIDAALLDTWRAAPRDAADLLAVNQPGEFLWIGGLLQGDGSTTAVLNQILVHHDEDGWLRYLPALYARTADEHPFLRRALALFETELDDEEALIDRLPRLFDAFGAPDDRDAPWLPWLAGWLDALLDDGWSPALRRRVTAEAFAMHARRGTRSSLRRLIRLYAGAHALIEEAQPDPPAWSLGNVSALGFETRLAPESAEGAVLDRTAFVDHSRLAEPGEFGPPIFEETAHHFHVSVYAPGDEHETLNRVRRVIDREKPAHTTYQLCAIRARMRTGFQARLGVDAIVGGVEPPNARLNGPAELGRDTTLAGTLTGDAAQLGRNARVGSTGIV